MAITTPGALESLVLLYNQICSSPRSLYRALYLAL